MRRFNAPRQRVRAGGLGLDELLRAQARVLEQRISGCARTRRVVALVVGHSPMVPRPSGLPEAVAELDVAAILGGLQHALDAKLVCGNA